MVKVNNKPCQNPIQLTRVMIKVGEITLKEAAERLGVSPTTARRMVKDGRLKAELRDGPRGPCYYVDESEIRTAQEITDVVPVSRPVSVEALADAVADAVAARIADTVSTRVQEALEASAKEQARTRAELEALTQEQARTREAMEALTKELAANREAQERIERSIEERDRKLTEALRKLTEREERRPWWVRILKRGR